MTKTKDIKIIGINSSIHDAVFTVFDVETTGLSPDRNRMTEIGIVRIQGGEVLDEYETLMNPGQFIPPEITRLTGITNELVFDKPAFETLAPDILSFINGSVGCVVLTGHNVKFDYGFLNASLVRSGYNKLSYPSICTARLARRLSRSLPSKSLDSLRRHFGIHSRRKHRAIDDARATATILSHFIEQLVNEYEFETVDEIIGFQYKKIYEESKISARFKKLKVELQSVPKKPGIYYMMNKKEEIIYIGKAKNLKDRMGSYFYHNVSHSTKIKKLVRYVHKVGWETTGSELSALLAESRLIKSHKPRFNSAIKSYRKFPFIKIDVQRAYPRVFKVYEIIPDGAKYYGPFGSSYTVNALIERIKKLYKLRKCDDRILRPAKNKSACMYYEFHQCSAPCNLTVSAAEYKKEVHSVDKFLTTSGKGSAIGYLESEMSLEADLMNYEHASYLRDNITDLKKVLLNIELTNSIVELQNYIIKCGEDNNDGSWEIFLVVNGKIAKTFIIDENVSADEDKVNNIIEEINYMYFSGALFKDFVFSKAYHKFKIDEIDTLKIISNWVYRNYTPTRVLKMTPKSHLGDVVKFVFRKP
ncbi:MAG: GIY-YIG nuclease family protein [Ignavibacteria bacterium]|nr:GIY-YIG nuclease family protein [Ignavibacteria bacterium]